VREITIWQTARILPEVAVFAAPRLFRPHQIAAVMVAVATVGLLSGCGGSSGGPVAAAAQGATPPVTTSSAPVTTSAAPTTSGSAPSTSGGGAKCSDLTNAAASASVGKPTTVKPEPTTPLPGLTICDVAVTGEVYPIQLTVDTNNGQVAYGVDQQALAGVDLPGVGDKAFSSAIGIETVSGNVDIKVTGPAGPVLSKIYTLPIAIAKAMIAALN
jgi:hypothetical protein